MRCRHAVQTYSDLAAADATPSTPPPLPFPPTLPLQMRKERMKRLKRGETGIFPFDATPNGPWFLEQQSSRPPSTMPGPSLAAGGDHPTHCALSFMVVLPTRCAMTELAEFTADDAV